MEYENGIEEIRAIFADDPFVLENLDAFLQTKESFIRDSSVDNRIAMKFAYVNIYEDLKVAWYGRKYNEDTFWRYVDALKDGL